MENTKLENITYLPDGRFRIDYTASGVTQAFLTPISFPLGRFLDNPAGTARLYACTLYGMFLMHALETTGETYKEPGAETLFEEWAYKAMGRALAC